MNEISKYCTGCSACTSICPKNCIELKKNIYGELEPVIDHALCIKCGACRNVCPTIVQPCSNTPDKVFAAKSRDIHICERSTSGGLSMAIAKEILSVGGIVYGTELIGLEAKVIRIAELEKVSCIQGSKYLQSHMYDALIQMKKDLLSGKKVVFLGTPCQIAGAKNYLKNYSENLFLVDILCHGAPSQDCFKSGIELEIQEEVESLKFRENNRYCLNIKTKMGNQISIPYRRSYWFNSFVEALIMREACYLCPYANTNRIGDISIGDFWGLGKAAQTQLDIDSGVNLVLINNPKGAILLDMIRQSVDLEEHKLEEAILYNHPLSAPASVPKNYDKFKELYSKYGGKKALIKAYRKKTIFVFIRRLVNKNKKFHNVIIKLPIVGSKLTDYPR